MKSVNHLFRSTLILVFTLGAALPAFGASSPHYSAVIRRTEYGIPHVEAANYGDLGFGLGYAYAQDNFCLLADRLITVSGERSEYFGPGGSVAIMLSNINNEVSDLVFKSEVDIRVLRRSAARLSREYRDMMRGYAAGYDRYLAEKGLQGLPAACRGAPWVRPMTYDDQLRLSADKLLEVDFPLFEATVGARPPGSADPAVSDRGHGRPAAVAAAGLFPGASMLGSNGWAFGRAVTQGGSGILLGNPHYPWATVNRFYEVQLTIPHELDVMGATFPGVDDVVIGFNRDVAWTHTHATNRDFTLFRLTLDPHDPTTYAVDGVRHQMARKAVELNVRHDGRLLKVRHTLYFSDYGPIVVVPQLNIAWTRRYAYAFRDADQDGLGGLRADFAIDRAGSVAAIQSILDKSGVPYSNTIAADRQGSVLYADVAPTPDVSDAKFASCAAGPMATAIAARAEIYILDGSKSWCNWRLMAGSAMPQLVRTDYVANSNDSFWLANPSAPITGQPAIVGLTEVMQNLRTRAGITEIRERLAGTDGLPGRTVTPDNVRDMIFRNWNFAAHLYLNDILDDCRLGANVKVSGGQVVAIDEACAILAKWDRRMNVDSRGASLFKEIWDEGVADIKDVYAVPFAPGDPIGTPRGLSKDPAKVTAIREAIAEGVLRLRNAGLALGAPLGKEQFRIVGSERIPLDGGKEGTLNALGLDLVKGVGFEPYAGSSYMQIVTFNRRGPVAWGLLTYSQSTDPQSPHFADQTVLYSRKIMPRLPFLPGQIGRDPHLTTTTVSD
jgi:acyl-homoserine-lactone acylase